MDLNKKNKDLLLGIILGDGSIYKVNNSYEIYIGHGKSQKDYLEWKVKLLNNSNVFEKPLQIKSKLIFLEQYDKQYLQYYAKKINKSLEEIYDIYFSENKRLKQILHNIHSDRSVAIWFMDDGSVFKKKKKHKDGSIYYLKPTLKLCTHCFSKDENLDIIDWFKKRYLIDAKLVSETKHNKKYYYVRFNSKESLKLFSLMKQYIDLIPSMKEKFSFFYEYYQL